MDNARKFGEKFGISDKVEMMYLIIRFNVQFSDELVDRAWAKIEPQVLCINV